MKEIFSVFKKIGPKQIIYPAIIAAFIILVAVLLTLSIRFLSGKINKIFVLDTQSINSQLLKVDMDKFNFIADRLGIVVSAPSPSPAPSLPKTAPEAQEATGTSQVPPVVLDKTLLKISILNSTDVQGLAKKLKAVVETEGFAVSNTSNSSPKISDTVIKIKESKKEYLQLLKAVILKEYALGDDETLEETNAYDAVIIIGGN
jgi:hypothetical protein